MNNEESHNRSDRNRKWTGFLSRLRFGLSTKLLLLTITFVMIAEILIFVPSVANFRLTWLEERLAAAQIATLAVDAASENIVPDRLREELLKNAQVHRVALKRANARRLVLQSGSTLEISGHYDIRDSDWVSQVWDALRVLLSEEGRLIRVVGQPGFGGGEFIEIVIAQDPLKAAMLQYGLNILLLSVVISFFTAALVYFTLNALLVRPITRITRSMVQFREDPENSSRVIVPSDRTDEIGVVERELAVMQKDLSETLQQKNHLAALGLAVSKINHDLRNMLANAQLISDRFGNIDDPTVQRFAPKLIASLDRAIRLCTDTLKFGQVKEAKPNRSTFNLLPLVEEIGESLELPRLGRIGWVVEMDENLQVSADRDQLYRVLTNLCRNSVQVLSAEFRESGEDEIRVSAERQGSVVNIEVVDTGPGIPERAKKHLFDAFRGVARKGGTGLGLAISEELIKLHGGELDLVDTDRGTRFRLTIPDPAVDLQAVRARKSA